MTQTKSVTAVFDRARSGYVRDFNAFDVFVFNVVGFSLGLALSTNPSFIASFAPNANLLIVVVLGALLALANGLTYGWFGAIMPSTGGDFIFVTRSLSHRLGFLTSWGFTACQVYGIAANLGFIMSVGVAPALVTIGVGVNSPSLRQFGELLGTPGYAAAGSVALLVLYFVLAYFDIAVNRVLVYGAFTFAVLGSAVMLWVLFSTSHTAFVSAFNDFVQKSTGTSDMYDKVITTAQQSKPAGNQMWWDSFQAVPLGFLCFLGFTYSVYVGGEVREPQKSQVRGIMGALLLGVCVFLFGMGYYIRMVSQDFHSALAAPTVQAMLGMPNSVNFFAGIVAPSVAVNVVMQLGNLMWFLLVPYVMIQVCTHNMIAWSQDQITPEWFLHRGGRANSPWRAILVICLCSLLCIGANYEWGVSLVGASALVAVAFGLTGLSAVQVPRTRPKDFAKAPMFMRQPFLGLTVFQIAGLISVAGFAWICFVSVWYPEISGGTRTRAIVMLIAVYATGLMLYDFMRARLRKRVESAGVDLDALFKEIPDD